LWRRASATVAHFREVHFQKSLFRVIGMIPWSRSSAGLDGKIIAPMFRPALTRQRRNLVPVHEVAFGSFSTVSAEIVGWLISASTP
ncbi:hypothetical protein AAE026_24270, partial [Bradyrhizobium sp. DN5]|uniref:hypothetical protein n=1 Tax=Bradyrhizobium sp. DN5 TaxID=3056950 RepID=UPI003524A3EE